MNWDVCQIIDALQRYSQAYNYSWQDTAFANMNQSFYFMLSSVLADLKNLTLFHMLTYFLYYLADPMFERKVKFQLEDKKLS